MPAEYLRLQPGDHGEVNSGDEHYIPVSETFLKRISRSYFSTTTGSRKSCAIWSAITIVGILTLIIGTAVYNGFGYTDLNFQIEGDKGENLSAETVALATPTTSKDDGADRPLILYAYHESPNARQNAIFFIHHGLHSAADFIFILNGHTNLTLLIPSAPNIRIIQRTNTCYDLGAYGEVLTSNNSELINKYNKFILLNGSIRGPFLPTWSRECWSDAYLAKVTDRNKLVGMTFNCEPIYGVRHLQSMIFATDRIGINTLLSVMSTCFPNWLSAVYGESNSTRAIINAGYTVSAMMTSFASQENYADECKHGDILLEGAYFGDNLHPYETIFQKANRDFGKDVLSRLTEWTDLAGYSSYEVCGKKKEELKPLGGWGRWEEARRTGYS
ncbi:hypothetical protein TWF970_002103 [Orbilia oligospora]|uniref:Uncharacterized protein n=1 Tax=Orbilia oligospora TaxID=2813651 RepID=A0A7C8VRA4_ORBOL|nr:hypothetical protein TWF970_002103 [Orbilia oligospora]